MVIKACIKACIKANNWTAGLDSYSFCKPSTQRAWGTLVQIKCALQWFGKWCYHASWLPYTYIYI